VPDLTTSRERYLKLLGVSVTEPVDLHEHGVTVCFIELPNTKIELMTPLGAESPVSAFLERNPSGGMHHVCYEVEDIRNAREQLVAGGARVLGAGEPKIGAHGLPVLFLHPKDFDGTLIELEEVTK
jgi:methylmalonyl-CoA/ethylmalonyl-CoA epimerase